MSQLYNQFKKLELKSNSDEFHVPHTLRVNKNKLHPFAKYATAYVMCKYKNKWWILVHKRSKVMTNPGLYSSQGGSIEVGETSLEGSLRELKEETGLDIKGNAYLFNSSPKFANYVYFVRWHDIIDGVWGPMKDFKAEIDLENDFSDLYKCKIIPGTGHCLMDIDTNIENKNLYKNFKRNLEYLMSIVV